MTHTLETLLPLLDKDGNPINQEASDKLRIWAAELDGWTDIQDPIFMSAIIATPVGARVGQPSGTYSTIPNYPTSLDAIFAAEKRVGLHDEANWGLREEWIRHLADIVSDCHESGCTQVDRNELVFATPAQRNIALILTLQQKQTL